MKKFNIMITIASALIVLSLLALGIVACLTCNAQTWEKVVGIILLVVPIGLESIMFYMYIWD
jgi:hypothetical protein